MEKQSVVIVGGASGPGLVTARLRLECGARRVGLIDKNEVLLAEGRGTDREIQPVSLDHTDDPSEGPCSGPDPKHASGPPPDWSHGDIRVTHRAAPM